MSPFSLMIDRKITGLRLASADDISLSRRAACKMTEHFFKKTALASALIPLLLVAGCQSQKTAPKPAPKPADSIPKSSKPAKKVFHPNLYHHYPGFKLASLPPSFQGTWYRSNPDDRTTSRLIISQHLVNGAPVYQQTDPSLRLDRNSAKQNQEYAGNGEIIAFSPNQIKVRGFFDLVDLVYTLGSFKGCACLYLSYGTNPNAVNGIVFKDRAAALKYRSCDLSKIRL